MSRMLHGFADALVVTLLQHGDLEVHPGREALVVAHVRDRLASVETGSLISEVVRALTSCEHVVELYADDDALIEIISDLGPAAARGR